MPGDSHTDNHAGRSWLFTGAAGVFSLGFTALVMSFVSEPLLPRTIGWSDQERVGFRVAAQRVRDLEMGVFRARKRVPELDPEPLALRLARAEAGRLRERFDRARTAPERLIRRLRNGGAIVLAIGAAMLSIAARSKRLREKC